MIMTLIKMTMIAKLRMQIKTSCKNSKPSTVSSVKVSHSSACFHLPIMVIIGMIRMITL